MVWLALGIIILIAFAAHPTLGVTVTLGLAGFLWWRHKQAPITPDEVRQERLKHPDFVPDEYASKPQPVPVRQRSRNHTPRPPVGEAHPLWGRLTNYIEAEGEFARPNSYRTLLRGRPGFDDYSGAEIKANLILSLDPENPHDHNAVAIWYNNLLLGYLPRGEAARYQAPIRAVGGALEVPGRIWASETDGRVHARTYFNVCEPGQLAIIGTPPREGESLIPVGSRMNVLGEENFMDQLADYVPDDGNEHMMWVRLAVSVDFRPRSARDRVDVFLEGDRIGWLSDTQTKNMLPLVNFLTSRGKTPVVRAVIAGSPIKAEVFLYVARAGEVTRDWLNAQGEEIAPSPAVKRPEFDWDD